MEAQRGVGPGGGGGDTAGGGQAVSLSHNKILLYWTSSQGPPVTADEVGGSCDREPGLDGREGLRRTESRTRDCQELSNLVSDIYNHNSPKTRAVRFERAATAA